jgi:autotransporter translocation and assembly factor TamB
VLKEATLALAADKFPVAVGSIGAWLDTHVKVEASSAGDTLNVDVQIENGTVHLPKLSSSRSLQSMDALADVKFIDKAAQEQAERLRAMQEEKDRERAARAANYKPPPPLIPPKLLAHVRMTAPLAIDGPEVKTEVQGQVSVRIEPPNLDGPIVTGAVHALGGSVEVLGRRYQITRAAVSLGGETPPNPLLDVAISRQLDTATISILVTGTASRPRISFSSEPAIYDESQIIAIVLSGQADSSIQAQALGALSSILVGSIKEQLGSLLPVDVIKFDVSGNDPMGLGSSSLEIGKYLRDNLYFSYMHRFGTATAGLRRLNIEEIRLEYRFLSRFQLTTRYGDAQVGTLDLYWTKRF